MTGFGDFDSFFKHIYFRYVKFVKDVRSRRNPSCGKFSKVSCDLLSSKGRENGGSEQIQLCCLGCYSYRGSGWRDAGNQGFVQFGDKFNIVGKNIATQTVIAL